MTTRGLYLFAMWAGVFLALTYALFAPVWFVSFPLGVMVAIGFVALMFAPVGKGEPAPPANRHNPEEWRKHGTERE